MKIKNITAVVTVICGVFIMYGNSHAQAQTIQNQLANNSVQKQVSTEPPEKSFTDSSSKQEISVNEFADSTKRGRGRTHTGGINFQVGYRNNNINQLNQAIAGSGFPALSDNNIWYNVSFNRIHRNKIITEFGLGFTAPSKSDINGMKIRYSQQQTFFRLGYNVTSSEDFRLYPFAGVNLTRQSLKITDEGAINGVNDFTSQILNKSTSKRINQTNFGIEIGAGFDYLIKLKPKQKGCYEVQRVLPVGIRVGQYFQSSAGDWKVEDHSLTGGPTKKNNGFFATLSIGLGYSVKK